MPAKVCILTTVHPPFDTRVFHKQAKTLVEAGYEVILIAQHDGDETVDGVKIVALPTPTNRLTRMFGLTWRALRLAASQRADVYHFHDPELLLAGVLLRVFTRARVIFDIHENVPQQILGKEWITRWLRLPISVLYRAFERPLVLACDAVVPVTEAVARNCRHRRVQVIHNYPHLAMFHGLATSNVPVDEVAKRLVYIGGISRRRGIVEMLAAVDCLTERDRVRLELIGGFSPPELEDEVREMLKRDSVNYRGLLPWHDAWECALGATAGLVLFHPGPNHSDAMPNKLFEYMAAGVPVVASDFPLWREIVEGSACGLVVDPLNIEAIVNAVQYLIGHPEEAGKMGQNGRRAVEETYNWETESRKLLDLYERILS